MSTMIRPPAASPDFANALRSCRLAFASVGVMSGVVNVLYLTGSFFMLEVYDRVIPSRSIPTLLGLAVLALSLFAFQGILDLLRGRVLVRIGGALDEALSGRVFTALVRLALKRQPAGEGLQPLRDLDQVRSFLSSIGPTALFDLPWMPFYLALCFLFHPLIGIVGSAGALVLVGMTLCTEFLTRAPSKEATAHNSKRLALAEASRRNAEALQAMGMTQRLAGLWGQSNARHLESQRRTSDVAGGLGAISKFFRMALQSGVLGVGAYLVIEQQASAGIIIAGSIITARALAPVELAIANWKGFVAARQGSRRLKELFAQIPADTTSLTLPKPVARLSVENLSVAPPGVQKLAVADVSLDLKAGTGLGVIGPSASGKSSLARALVGVWAPARGKVRLDGAALEQWSSEALGPHIGYLPQDVELFAGTVAQNIARFTPDPEPEAVLKAAKAAGVNDLILRLPNGYETQIGEGGAALSAGQRQRVALARALYGDPFLVVLDEPNSNLDMDGEAALTQAILGVRQRGGIAIVVAHRPSALNGIDQVLVMKDGHAQACGPKEEVLGKVLQQRSAQAAAASRAGPQPAGPRPASPVAAQRLTHPGPLKVVGDSQSTNA